MTTSPEPSSEDRAAIGVLVVEDHPDMRDAVAETVARTVGFVVVATAATGDEALRLVDAGAIDIALIDLSLPDMSGNQLIDAIGRRTGGIRCVVLSGHREPHYVEAARIAGASGYVVKGHPRHVQEALGAVAAGEHYFSPGLAVPPGGAARCTQDSSK